MLLALPGSAHAQDDGSGGDDAVGAGDGASVAPETTDAATSGDDPAGPEGLAPLPARPQPWAPDHLWHRTGLSLDLVAGAVDGLGGVYALAFDGSVWRWDGGAGWREVLEGAGAAVEQDDEDLLLEAESSVDDLVDTDDLAEQEYDDAGDPLPDAVDLTSEATDIALVDADSRTEAHRAAAGRLVWVPEGDPRSVYVGRSDGLWVSRDGGLRWTRLAEVSGAAAMLPEGGGLLLGTAEGLWSAPDGRRFRRLLPGLGMREVRSLVPDGEGILAATSDGLWHRDGDGYWQRTAGSDGLDVYDVLPDPSWDDGLWLATSAGLLRSDDGGRTVRQASRNPLRGVRRLLPLAEPGHILAAGDDGVWESNDGGTTWAPLAQGLDEPVVRALLRTRAGTVHLLGKAGAYALLRAPTAAEEGSEAAALTIPTLDEVVARAMERPGLSMDQLSFARRVVLARFAPKLDILGRYYPRFNRDSDYVGSVTREEVGPYWIVEARVCWGLCDDTVDVYIDYDDLSSVTDATELADLGVVGGKVYDFTGDTAVPVAAANVAAEAISYRTAIADIVTRAWFRRRELAVQGDGVEALPLAEQLAWRLDVDEVDARLDLYTDGWYAQALAAND